MELDASKPEGVRVQPTGPGSPTALKHRAAKKDISSPQPAPLGQKSDQQSKGTFGKFNHHMGDSVFDSLSSFKKKKAQLF